MNRLTTNNQSRGGEPRRRRAVSPWYPDDVVPEAAALSYDSRSMFAPEVCAVGRCEIVKKMRDVARRFGVPIVEHAELAERLCALSENTPVPPSLYPEVARVLLGRSGQK